MISRKSIVKNAAICLLIALGYETVSPLVAYALTGGPSQPEFSRFESVSTDNLVDPFSGSFTYNIPVVNIPGPNGSGYALSLSYHSGMSPEEEASWVGYGWTLNPGAISRQKRGLPDDYEGSNIRHWNKTESNWTIAAYPTQPIESFSTDIISGSLGISSVSYNNHMGFGYVAGASVSLKDGSKELGSLGFNVDNGYGSFDPAVNIGAIISKYVNIGAADVNVPSMRFSAKSPCSEGAEASASSSSMRFSPGNALMGLLQYPFQTFGDNRRSTTASAYTGTSIKIGAAVDIDPVPVPVGNEIDIKGSYSEQKPVPLMSIPSYGYMYSNEGRNNPAAAMDYALEKESPYVKRDRFLAIPYSQPDNYTVSGEGVGGGFRLQHTKIGDFHPNQVTSKTKIGTFAGDVELGGAFGMGGDFGLGEHTLSVDGWLTKDDHNLSFADPSLGDGGCYFQYYNDVGGSATNATDDKPVRASIYSGLAFQIPGTASYEPILNQVDKATNHGNRIGRSSYIGYHTNREMLATGVSGRPGSMRKIAYGAYCKDKSVASKIDRGSVPTGVGEFSVTASNGNQYTYGLPVYARREKNLQYGLYGENPTLENDYIAYKSFAGPDQASKVVGEERDDPYATMYLLTAITTPDYVDRTGDGPTPDDFGGYTKFNYRRVAGTYNKNSDTAWYKWRVPYRGLLFEKNANWDPRDNMGMVMMGEREVYYLESIETKTHIARFITNKTRDKNGTLLGSGLERLDGYPAIQDEAIASGNASYVPTGSNPSEMLERVELWSKNDVGELGKLLQTTHLRYSYELSKNLPNSAAITGGGTAGKLTLKQLWTEYEGTQSVRISPYVFGYSYSTTFGSKTSARYPDATGYGAAYASNAQNPNYSALNIDRWGYYQYGGAGRHSAHRDWIYQNPAEYQDPVTHKLLFDPAAWQLKWIHLPSGGEIHVQYEQNQYTTVQDRPTLAMVRLKPGGTTGVPGRFYLDVTDLGIPMTCTGGTPSPELRQLVANIRKAFLPDNQPKVPIYFKFLYDLLGFAPSISSCGSEFISGYVLIDDVGIDADCRPYIVLQSDATDNITNPHQICADYVRATGAKSFRFGVNCYGSDAVEPSTAVETISQLLTRFQGFIDGSGSGCAAMEDTNSYFRIPMTRAKFGGGIRVKRLLTYDPGIETDDDNLYGSEYVYQTTTGDCSGVATNEPETGREENSLVTCFPKRRDQSWLERVIAGRDREEFEGPIGEAFLPAPAVGYSRVVTKGINGGKTGKGFVVNEFYTARDYPYDKYYSDNGQDIDATIGGRGVDETEIDPKQDWVYLPAGCVTYSVYNFWLSQGYRFVLNNMHGQPKTLTSFGGDYADTTTWYVSSSTAYTYFEPGQKIPVMYGIGDIRMEYPGRDMEVTSEGRTISDETVQGTLEGDLAISGFFPPIFYVSLAPKDFAFDQKQLRTYVTTKIVRYPALVQSVTTVKDGIKSTVEYVGFSPETGQPIATRSYDGFHQLLLGGSSTPHNGMYTAYDLPASWSYKELGQKAGAEHMKFVSESCGASIDKWTSEVGTYLTFRFRTPQAYTNVLSRFSPGDLVRITIPHEDPSHHVVIDTIGVLTVTSIQGYKVFLTPTSMDAIRSTQAFEPGVTVEIISSGRTNELNLPAQQITTYGPPSLPTRELVP